jgi:tetratricopeptide (TPR) repeat protein
LLFAGAAALFAAAPTFLCVEIGRRKAATAAFLRAHDLRGYAESQIDAARWDDAEPFCRQGLVILDSLPARIAAAPDGRRERGSLYELLGRSLTEQAIPHEAIPAFKEAIDVWSKLLAESPESQVDREHLAHSLVELGDLCTESGRWDEAESTLVRGVLLCVNVPASRQGDSSIRRAQIDFLNRLGKLYHESSRPAEAIDAINRAVALAQDLARSGAAAANDRALLASLHLQLSGALLSDRRIDGAQRALAEALDESRALLAEFPGDIRYLALAATILENRAKVLNGPISRRAEARADLEKALALRAYEGSTARGLARTKRAAIHERLAETYREDRAFAKAELHYRAALTFYEESSVQNPGAAADRFREGRVIHNLAEMLRMLERPAEAIALAHRAVEALGAAFRHDATNPAFRAAYRKSQWTLCALLVEGDDPGAAALAIAEYLKIGDAGFEVPLEAARFYCRCATHPRASASDARGGAGTHAFADQAMGALAIAVRNGYRDLADLEASSTYSPLRSHPDFERLRRTLALRLAQAE